MLITVNLKDNPFFQEAFAEGKQEGREDEVFSSGA